GENLENIRKWGHEKLSTFGLLKGHSKADLRDWMYQLIGQEVLLQVGDEYPKLHLNAASWEVMKGQRKVRLVQLARKEQAEKSKAETVSWEGVDRGLFETLRSLRKQLAEERKVPPYVIFSDATLRELARMRPSSLERMRLVYGIGDAKLRDFGKRFLDLIQDHCRENSLSTDQAAGPVRVPPPKPATRPNPQRDLAFDLFRQGAAIEDVMQQTNRRRPTVLDYLAEFVRE